MDSYPIAFTFALIIFAFVMRGLQFRFASGAGMRVSALAVLLVGVILCALAIFALPWLEISPLRRPTGGISDTLKEILDFLRLRGVVANAIAIIGFAIPLSAWPIFLGAGVPPFNDIWLSAAIGGVAVVAVIGLLICLFGLLFLRAPVFPRGFCVIGGSALALFAVVSMALLMGKWPALDSVSCGETLAICLAVVLSGIQISVGPFVAWVGLATLALGGLMLTQAHEGDSLRLSPQIFTYAPLIGAVCILVSLFCPWVSVIPKDKIDSQVQAFLQAVPINALLQLFPDLGSKLGTPTLLNTQDVIKLMQDPAYETLYQYVSSRSSLSLIDMLLNTPWVLQSGIFISCIISMIVVALAGLSIGIMQLRGRDNLIPASPKVILALLSLGVFGLLAGTSPLFDTFGTPGTTSMLIFSALSGLQVSWGVVPALLGLLLMAVGLWIAFELDQ